MIDLFLTWLTKVLIWFSLNVFVTEGVNSDEFLHVLPLLKESPVWDIQSKVSFPTASINSHCGILSPTGTYLSAV